MYVDYLDVNALFFKNFSGVHSSFYHNSACKDGNVFALVNFVGFEKVKFIVLIIENIRSILAEHTDINRAVVVDYLRQRLFKLSVVGRFKNNHCRNGTQNAYIFKAHMSAAVKLSRNSGVCSHNFYVLLCISD